MKNILLVALITAFPVYAQPASTATTRAQEAARTEGAIAGGLKWLANNQLTRGAEEGAWPVNIGNYRPAVTSLVGLAFLANGHLPGDDGPYGKTLQSALKYVMGTMASDGYLGQGDRSGMYIHAISSLFALSCLGMQADESLEPDLAEWCRRSLDLILQAQKVSRSAELRGGWRYDPYTTDSDISVTCWQLLVLHAGRQAGFEVEPTVYNSALAYLARAYGAVQPEGGESKETPPHGYFYPDRRSGGHASGSSSSLVVFIQSLYGASNEKQTEQALTYLRRFPPTWDGDHYGGFFYFSSFYMVQGMFQIGGKEWAEFGPAMAKQLLDHQAGDGSWPYPPNNKYPAQDRGTGPAYPAALAVLMLSIEKQYLPMYQRQSRLYGKSIASSLPVAKVPDQAATPENKPSTVSKGDSELVVPEAAPEILPDSPAGMDNGDEGMGSDEGNMDDGEGTGGRNEDKDDPWGD